MTANSRANARRLMCGIDRLISSSPSCVTAVSRLTPNKKRERLASGERSAAACQAARRMGWASRSQYLLCQEREPRQTPLSSEFLSYAKEFVLTLKGRVAFDLA